MILSDMIDLLNEDLSNEYKHWHFYMHAAIMVQGLHREQLKTFLLAAAAGETNHIQQFGDLILGLGGKPTAKVSGFATSLATPAGILREALDMEKQVVARYVERKAQAEKMGGIEGARISIFLDNQILDSGSDADNIKQMLAGHV